MKRETSIRFRLTLWYASVLAAGLIVFAGLIWISLRQTLMHEVDRELDTRAHGFELFLRNELAEVPVPPLEEELEEFCTALPSLSYLRVRSLDRNFAFSYPANSPAPGTGGTRPRYSERSLARAYISSLSSTDYSARWQVFTRDRNPARYGATCSQPAANIADQPDPSGNSCRVRREYLAKPKGIKAGRHDDKCCTGDQHRQSFVSSTCPANRGRITAVSRGMEYDARPS